ncbi:ABC transporter substrate-binding protein [Prosthecomicrobium sp. N25]|uniref:ABC transporter substrate-binding protein n=1 Tax=Prosthecomicrobium sp. N25 TaxID=3129254 RepID=UPI003076A3C2
MTSTRWTLTRRHFGGLALSTAAIAAWPGAYATAATPKDTLVLAFAFDDIITMDPAEAFEISAGEIMGNCYDRLMRLNAKDTSKVDPDIAKSYEVSEDGKLFTFKLKTGLKFASGNPITADDVAYSLQRAVTLDKTPAFILTQFGFTKDNVKDMIKAVDPATVTITTDKVYATSLVLNCLTANVACIVDKQLVESKAQGGDMGYAWLKTNYAGSGPYKLREWRANELIVLERNENYYGEKARLGRVIYRYVKESATQRLMLEKGDIDIARNVTPQDIDALTGAGMKTSATAKATSYYISLNQKNPNLAKPEVREAFKYIIDYDAIGATLLKHIGTIHQHFLPVGMLGALETKPFSYNPEKAKELLAKAGLKDGFKVSMDVRTVQPVQGVAEAIQQAAAKVGIQIEIIPGDGKQTLTKYRARQHDIYIGQWGADYWDPHTNADTFTRNPNNADDAKSKPLAWRNAWDIPELTAKTNAAALERDTAKRTAMYADIQNEFVKTSPFVMIWQQTDVALYRPNVEGFQIGKTSDNTALYVVTKS